MQKIIKKLKKIWWALRLFFTRIRYGNASKKLKIIGVTGTNGKTTTATLLYKVATVLGYKVGLIGTVENIIGFSIVLHDEKAPSTTPDSIYLTKLLRKMLDEGCEYVFMEVSSHALDQNRVAGINFTGGIFTNLTHDHLDYHKNFENYFGAKKKFFTMLPTKAFALTNVDDEYGKKMLEDIKARKFSYGFLSGVGPPTVQDFHGEIKKLDFDGLQFSINKKEVRSRLLGKFNAYNLLAVWSTCKLLNFDLVKVNKILESIEPPRGRFDYYISQNGIVVIIDYAHTPDALEKVLLTIKEIKSNSGRIISVFGCGGDRDPLKRSKMGKIGASLSDIAIFTSDNPRSENSDKIIDDMKSDLVHEENIKVVTIADRRLAIGEAVETAQKGDIILCAGKGHEDYQEINGKRIHFNDMEEFKKVLK